MNKNSLVLLFLLSCVTGLFCPASSVAQVTVDVKIDSLELFIGQQAHITLDVSCDSKSKLQMPALRSGDMLVPGVEIVDVARPDTQMLNEGARRMISQQYTITSFDSSFYYLPPFEVKVDGQVHASKNLALRVLTVPVDTVHVDRFYGPKEIMDVPFSWEDWRDIFWYSVLLLIWVLALSYFYIRYRDNKPIIKIIKLAPKIPPHTKAMQEIDQIKAEKAWTKEDSKEYYTRLTDTLRIYIRNRYGFNAMEMTSSEIIDRLLETGNEEALDELRSLFVTADLVKFAKYNAEINENDRNLVHAIEYINQTKIEVDPNQKKEPEEVTVEQKRSRRTVLLMRLSLGFMTLVAVGLVGWIVWMIDMLVA